MAWSHEVVDGGRIGVWRAALVDERGLDAFAGAHALLARGVPARRRELWAAAPASASLTC